MRSSLLLALMLLVPQVASAKSKKPAVKYHVEVTGTESVPGVPKALAEKAKTVLVDVLAKRPEFVATLAGAPDMAQDPVAFKKYLDKKKIRAFKVVIKMTRFERELAPKPDSKSQVLKIHVALQLLGTGKPDNTMALTGDGLSQVGLEVGQKVRPKDEEVATDESLRNALTSAVDDAVRKLAAAPPAKPTKR